MAHEVQNPLNFINNFSGINLEIVELLKSRMDGQIEDEIKEALDDLEGNSRSMKNHGERVAGVVSKLLKLSRKSDEET